MCVDRARTLSTANGTSATRWARRAFGGLAVSLVLTTLATARPCLATQRASVHVVQPGQKLASIAKRYGMSLEELCQANGLKKSARIYPGQRLNIPSPDADGISKSEAAPPEDVAPRERTPPPARNGSRSGSSSVASRYEALPKHKGQVRVIGYHGDWLGQLVDRRGHLVTKSAVSVSRILAWPHKDFHMNERLLTLLAQVSDHFGSRPLRVVSGYRTTSWVEESKHPLGRACDFVVLGVPNTVLRDYLRTLDNVGVGYYPNSTFVHLDVRERNTYWVDYAGPGEPPRLTPTAVIPRDPSASADLQAELAASASDVPAAPEADTANAARDGEQPRTESGVAARSSASTSMR
jgi:LysM repeat protein